MKERIRTIIIGSGQAGCSLSYYLTSQGHDHIILEASPQPAEAWRNRRWDSFTLVTPNWHINLPGRPYQGNDPEGYLPRIEIVSYLEDYIQRFRLPIRYQSRVTSVEPQADGKGYFVRTGSEEFRADQVVVATGMFQKPKIPAGSSRVPASIFQITSDEYRNPQGLPPGAVLVVGSGQSGCQIAEELYQSGRKVYLCIGSAGRVERRYRGKDILWWWERLGILDQTVDRLPSPRARFAGNPHVSGKGGGHSLNLHQFARDGVTLLGRIQAVDANTIRLAPDLMENLAKADRFCAENLKAIDEYIAKNGLDAPEEKIPELHDGYQTPELAEMDLRAAGVSTLVWAIGYTRDFSYIKLPVVDEYAYPIQNRGVTSYPGLFFLGLPWLHTRKSGLFIGVGEDAAYLAERIIR